MHVAVPTAITQPRLRIPRWSAIIRLPNPAMVVRPEMSTALPVLLPRMAGVRSSANRFRIWMPLVTPIQMTSGRVIILAGLNGMPVIPMKPTIQSAPMATGSSDSTTRAGERKWMKTKRTMAPSAHPAASM